VHRNMSKKRPRTGLSYPVHSRLVASKQEPDYWRITDNIADESWAVCLEEMRAAAPEVACAHDSSYEDSE
jgi:hypothetical protein